MDSGFFGIRRWGGYGLLWFWLGWWDLFGLAHLPICLFDCLNGWVCLVCWCVGVKKRGGVGVAKAFGFGVRWLGLWACLGFSGFKSTAVV